MKLKIIIFLIKSLLPVEPKDRKTVIKAVFGGFHLRKNPTSRKSQKISVLGMAQAVAKGLGEDERANAANI